MEAAVRPNSPNPADTVDRFRRRAYRHADEDGAIDLVVGLFTLSTGRLWNLDGWPTWVPPLAGLTLAAGFLDTARKSGVARFHVFAALSVAGSVFFWLFPFGPRINPSDRLTLFLFAMAGVLMAVGAVTMAAFVRTKPVVPDEASNVR